MDRKILLYIAVLVSTLFVMPYTVSLITGMHTFITYSNSSCESCHADFKGEVNTSNIHKNPASNVNYTTYLAIGGTSYDSAAGEITDIYNDTWEWNSSTWRRVSDGATKLVDLDMDNSGDLEIGEVCLFCHSGELSNSSSHVAMVRGCDDDRCHGNSVYNYNDPELFGEVIDNKTGAGWYLARNNIHSPFYTESNNQPSHFAASESFGYTQGNTYNSFISQGYLTCFSCHSNSNFSISISGNDTFSHDNSSEPYRRYI